MFKILYLTLISTLLFSLSGCSSQSLENYKEEGRGITHSLIEELKDIHTRDDLLASTPRLKQIFDQLADVMVQSQQFSINHPEYTHPELTKEDHEISDQLRIEMNRIFRIEGGRATIEKCQEDAIKRLY